MDMIRNAAFAATAFACLSTTAIAAPRETVTARVSYADLDMASPAGRTTFDRRLNAAIDRACPAEERDLASFAAVARCRDEMRRDGATQLTALRVHPVQMASAR